jgi:hypothetical protein
MLRYNQEIAIRIHGSSLLHTRVCQEGVDGQTLTEGGVARTGNGLETVDKVNLAMSGNVKGEPS